MRSDRPAKKQSVWEQTRYRNLFRYVPSGTIFARLKISGKQVRKSLKTPNLELAKNKLAELERNERSVAEDRRRGKMTFGEALDEYIQSRKRDADLKPRTKAYDDQQVVALLKSWPGLRDQDIRRINSKQCEVWAEKFAELYCPSAYNHTLAIVKHTFEGAIDRGVRYDNPAKKINRQSERPKKLTLPSQEEFAAFVNEIESGGSGKSQPCADLVMFLAYSGCRKMEAANVTWADISFEPGILRIHGDPQSGTKNGESRTVPMIKEMRALLTRLKSERPNHKPTDYVMTVRECQKAMNRAANLVGMKRITHHDLRHLFATTCIESGVDIPTVSRWLGHKDGGALAMKTYGHLRDEHSLAMAQKVSFNKNSASNAGEVTGKGTEITAKPTPQKAQKREGSTVSSTSSCLTKAQNPNDPLVFQEQPKLPDVSCSCLHGKDEVQTGVRAGRLHHAGNRSKTRDQLHERVQARETGIVEALRSPANQDIQPAGN